MQVLNVTSIGLRREEPFGFTIDRPLGMGQFLFLRFYTPMEIRTTSGVSFAEAGTCILYPPDSPQWYRGYEVGLINDWMYLEGAGVKVLMERYGLPLNQLLKPRDTRFISPLLEVINQEYHLQGRFYSDAIGLYVEELILKLARYCQEEMTDLTPVEAGYLPAFRSLRLEIHEQFAQDWSVEEMAVRVHLSPSRFASLYRQFFEVSPMEDLIRVRLDNARMLLTNRAATVSEAAAQSGFANVSYFSRLFRRRVGCAPRDYYRTRLFPQNVL